MNQTIPQTDAPVVQAAAYYFPSWHPDVRNDQWHGKGWTEWELMKRARPRFDGHRQPIVPEWGYFDESDPGWAEREIELASSHGLTAFIYDWYWYEDGGFLQDGLDRGFLGAANSGKMKFALMWANHDWPNIHPAKLHNPWEVTLPGKISRERFDQMVEHIIESYFTRPNYWTVGRAPYFSIYEVATFVQSMGGLSAARDTLESFRQRSARAGFPDIHLNAIVWGIGVLPSEAELSDPVRVVRELGFSSVGTYTWVHHSSPNDAGFPRGSYAGAAEANFKVWKDLRATYPVPYHPNVTMGWDPSPRTIQSDVYESRGYPWTSVLVDNTPEAFADALKRARAFAEGSDGPNRIVTINAWNEWTEGSYLLPDRHFGSAYLDAVKDVFAPARS